MIRLVVVDDHEIVREGLKTILQGEPDFDVVGESGTAEQLTQLVDETRPDVILLDARLPGVSGAEACRRLTSSHPDIAVLMISTYSDQQLVEECIRAGAKGYVVKDIERFTLKESIRALHAGGGAVSPTVAATVLDCLRGRDESPVQPASIPLSDTQLQIVRLIASGLSNREIADQVHLSHNTVKSHVQEIFRKLDVGNRVEAALDGHSKRMDLALWSSSSHWWSGASRIYRVVNPWRQAVLNLPLGGDPGNHRALPASADHGAVSQEDEATGRRPRVRTAGGGNQLRGGR